MDAKYSKKEKLKSKKEIDLLFLEGKSVSHFPFRLVFLRKEMDDSWIKFGVSVSKRNVKRAVDRNFIKRRMRECFRLHKPLLAEVFSENYICMLVYTSKELISFKAMEQKYLALLKKLNRG